MTVYGYDSLGRPTTPQRAAELGFRFVWHYLGAVSRQEVDAYHAVGIDVGLFFEHGAYDARGGSALGRTYGQQALALLDLLGAPPTVPATVACDYFPTDPAEVLPYFAGAHEVLGGRLAGYGNQAVVDTLARAGLGVGYVQSRSGSTGVSPHAHYLQHNDAVPADAPSIPAERLLADYDLEQELVPGSPLLWRAHAAKPATPIPAPHPTEDDTVKVAIIYGDKDGPYSPDGKTGGPLYLDSGLGQMTFLTPAMADYYGHLHGVDPGGVRLPQWFVNTRKRAGITNPPLPTKAAK